MNNFIHSVENKSFLKSLSDDCENGLERLLCNESLSFLLGIKELECRICAISSFFVYCWEWKDAATKGRISDVGSMPWKSEFNSLEYAIFGIYVYTFEVFIDFYVMLHKERLLLVSRTFLTLPPRKSASKQSNSERFFDYGKVAISHSTHFDIGIKIWVGGRSEEPN